jgi:hypothetical protein
MFNPIFPDSHASFAIFHIYGANHRCEHILDKFPFFILNELPFPSHSELIIIVDMKLIDASC